MLKKFLWASLVMGGVLTGLGSPSCYAVRFSLTPEIETTVKARGGLQGLYFGVNIEPVASTCPTVDLQVVLSVVRDTATQTARDGQLDPLKIPVADRGGGEYHAAYPYSSRTLQLVRQDWDQSRPKLVGVHLHVLGWVGGNQIVDLGVYPFRAEHKDRLIAILENREILPLTSCQ